jgi:hypothetical protein
MNVYEFTGPTRGEIEVICEGLGLTVEVDDSVTPWLVTVVENWGNDETAESWLPDTFKLKE